MLPVVFFILTTVDFHCIVAALMSGLHSSCGRRGGAERLVRMGADGLGGAGAVVAIGEPCLMLMQCVLMTTFDIGRRSDMGTAGTNAFHLSSEGREGVICVETGTDGLCSSGITCTGELDFAFVFPLLTLASVLTGCNNLSFGR